VGLRDLKLDGYRAIAVKSGNKVSLFSRRRKSFNQQYPYIVEALSDLPNGTVIDGEIVALGDSGRPEFNQLQSYRRDAGRIRYFVFDLLCQQNRDTTRLPLVERRELLRSLKFQSSRIQLVDYLETSAANIVAEVKEQGLEGVIAKRRDSLYQSGRRTGAWVKYRIN
jgi:ATP-dependent DNA ligase